MATFLRIFIFLCLSFCSKNTWAQLTLSGTVFDSSKINLVEGVRVQSNTGAFTYTDSMGKYKLAVSEADTVFFSFRNKPTQNFPVKNIPNPTQFDIWLHIKVKGKFTTLKEVVIRSKSYRLDSIENRKKYADVFGFRSGKIETSITPSGGVGLDINELINIFRFRRNRQLKAFRNRLEMDEKERYINYKFNKTVVSRITNLKNAELDTFMVRYRPDFDFVQQCNELTFNQYILNASYHYKMEMLKPDAIKE